LQGSGGGAMAAARVKKDQLYARHFGWMLQVLWLRFHCYILTSHV
jgi:hypothetical protein